MEAGEGVGVDEQRLAEIEAIEPVEGVLWVVGDERLSTKGVIAMLVAEVRRLRSALEPFASVYEPWMATRYRTLRDGPFTSDEIREAHHALNGEPA
jgi:hypothetical protein